GRNTLLELERRDSQLAATAAPQPQIHSQNDRAEPGERHSIPQAGINPRRARERIDREFKQMQNCRVNKMPSSRIWGKGEWDRAPPLEEVLGKSEHQQPLHYQDPDCLSTQSSKRDRSAKQENRRPAQPDKRTVNGVELRTA